MYPRMVLGVMNDCLRDLTVIARVVLIPKGMIGRYRSIRLLSLLGKLLEQIVKARYEQELKCRSDLRSNQFGFMKGRSTVDGIRTVVDMWEESKGGRRSSCST